MTTTTIGSGYVSFSSATYVGVYAAAGSTPTLRNDGTVGAPSGYALSFVGSGTVLNFGSITGPGDVFIGGAGASLFNQGTITASGQFQGIKLAAGGSVSNASSGVIDGAVYAPARGGAMTLNNAGLVNASIGATSGASLEDGGTVINSGTISGANRGVDIRGAAGVVTNTGSINGAGQYGIVIYGAPGEVHNNGGTITNANVAVALGGVGGFGTVVNSGVIAGGTSSGKSGVSLSAGGIVTNAAGGTITGFDGINSAAAASVYNYGSIGGVSHGINLAGADSLKNGGTITGEVLFHGHGYVDNLNGGLISATAANGMYLLGTDSTVVNAGTVVATTGNGVRVLNGGTVTNLATGSITGHGGGVVFTGTGTVVNAGSITGTTQYGVFLVNGGHVSNQAAGTITGGKDGVYIKGGLGTVINAGSIGGGNTSSGGGVTFAAGGVLTNLASGRISGTLYGIATGGSSGPLVVDNEGSVGSGAATGVSLGGGGTITNGATSGAAAYITGAQNGVLFGNTLGSVFNYGGIAGFGDTGIDLPGGGYVFNAGTGTGIYGKVYGVLSAGTATLNLINGRAISGETDGVSGTGSVFNAGNGAIFGRTNGVVLGAGSTLVNDGVITGYSNAAVLGSGSRLVIEPGAQFYGMGAAHGAVSGSGSTMELASSTAATTGLLNGVGQYFTGFGTIVVDPGANWNIVNVTAATAITAGDGSLSLLGSLDAGTSFALDSTGSGETLTLGAVTGASTAIAISNVSHHDKIVLPQETFAAGDTAALVNGNTLNVYDSGHSAVFSFTNLTPASSAIAAGFTVGADFVQAVACFRAGTPIAIPGGEAAVERLAAGDLVVTLDGPRPVRWLGRRRIDCRRHPRPGDVLPVRIAPDAFGPGAPATELFLSPDHAVFVEGVLVPIRYLANGASIAQVDAAEVEYFHVELETHAVLFAANLPCESYLDTGNRAAFENGGTAVALHPDFARRVWASAACAELLLAGPRLHAIRRHLIGRLPDLGYRLTADPALSLDADGIPLEPQHDGAWMCVAPLPDTACLRLRSRHAAPAELDADSNDTRRLGVALRAIAFDGVAVSLDDPRLGAGWHAVEADLRWTDGDAVLHIDGTSVVELWLAPSVLRYRADEETSATRAA